MLEALQNILSNKSNPKVAIEKEKLKSLRDWQIKSKNWRWTKWKNF